MASGSGETEAPADSVVEIGQVCAKLPAPGRAVLRLRLAGGAGTWTNGYEFEVRDASRAIISGTVTKR